MQCSKMSGPVCAWIEAHAYLFDKTGGEDFLAADSNRSKILGPAITTDDKELPFQAGLQTLEYEPIHPIADHALQAETKARFDSALTVLGTKSLIAQGFRVVESAPLRGGRTHDHGHRDRTQGRRPRPHSHQQVASPLRPPRP
jgi:hypothetical protein